MINSYSILFHASSVVFLTNERKNTSRIKLQPKDNNRIVIECNKAAMDLVMSHLSVI
jgi:hypothetical protein